MAGDVCMCALCMLGCCIYVTSTILLSLLLTECECVCVRLWAVGRIVVGGLRLGVGWWLGGVCVVLGWSVRSPSRLLLLSHKAMRALQAAGREPRNVGLF